MLDIYNPEINGIKLHHKKRNKQSLYIIEKEQLLHDTAWFMLFDMRSCFVFGWPDLCVFLNKINMALVQFCL